MSDSGSAERDLAREREQRDAHFTAPLPQRLRAAADAVIELNAMEGFHAPERAGVSAKYLLEAADRMEADE